MSTVQTLYPAGTTGFSAATGGGYATSSGFTLGGEMAAIDNTTTKDLDHIILGALGPGIGASTTAGTQCQVWVIPVLTDDLAGTVTWPDVFDGTNGNETVTSYGILQGCGKLGQTVNIDTTSSSAIYQVCFSVAALFGGVLPTQYVIFTTQNSGTTFINTSLDPNWYYQRMQAKVA